MLSSLLGVCLDLFLSEIIFPAFHNVLAECVRENAFRVAPVGHTASVLGRTGAASRPYDQRSPQVLSCAKGTAMSHGPPSRAGMWRATLVLRPHTPRKCEGPGADGTARKGTRASGICRVKYGNAQEGYTVFEGACLRSGAGCPIPAERAGSRAMRERRTSSVGCVWPGSQWHRAAAGFVPA